MHNNNAVMLFAAREVMGGWPATPGEPDWWEDILPNCYQSLQSMWLCLQQGAPAENHQRLLAILSHFDFSIEILIIFELKTHLRSSEANILDNTKHVAH